MSSSSSIKAQINQCKNEISDCEEQIRKLKNDISDKDELYIGFQQKATDYSDILTRKKNKSEAIFEFSGSSTLAKGYCDRMGFELADKRSKEQQLIDIESQMNTEIQNNKNDLSSLESQLINLNNRLSSLEREYQSALRREEEQRQAAAAAAAANNSKK